ncbi:MAG: VOC family protein [Rhodospirillales bacterium]|nr:VOC family protein [Rhodospirillales bacterium]
MSGFGHIQLYVRDPATSSRFYATLLQREPVDASPTFVLFVGHPNGTMIGLWQRDGVEPAAAPSTGAAGELGWRTDSPEEVEMLHAAWAAQGVTIAQPPTEMDFGRTFTALDPDGNRLREFALRG